MIIVEVFPSAVFLCKTLLWESEKIIWIVFLIICGISIKTLLILINYQKWYIILVTKRIGLINKYQLWYDKLFDYILV